MGVDRPDFVVVTGDAYIDHPSFGIAVISRLLQSLGFTVGIIAQPDWKDINSFRIFGQPYFGFLVSGGNIDSMVAHYSVAKKPRDKDYYSPGGKTGKRPDRALIVYSNKIREAYPETAIILGGLEASLRRLSHYDYWDNAVRRSVLLDAAADILVYGMGEKQITEIARRLRDGEAVRNLTDIPGTVYKTRELSAVSGFQDAIRLQDFTEIKKPDTASKQRFAQSFMTQYDNTDYKNAKTLYEAYPPFFVVQNPPAEPLSTAEFDKIYNLPYMRTFHPMYTDGVPAIEEIALSIISSRGCFGSCNFCALTFHQGRYISARSHKSILSEAKRITEDPSFKGYIHDVGGPTANFRLPSCSKQGKVGMCKQKRCLFPKPCKELNVSHEDYCDLLEKLSALPKVKKVFIRSGIRFDYLMADKSSRFFNRLLKHHISGQLKVAPEHVNDAVLHYMGKPTNASYEAFSKRFSDACGRLGLQQYLVPYFMSSHPGCTLEAAVDMAVYLHKKRISPQQVQDFYPTPGTLSTCMYYTETDPRTGNPVYVAKSPHEKAMQRALMQFRLPQNRKLVREALSITGRSDLPGFGDSGRTRDRDKGKGRGKDRGKPKKRGGR